MVSSDKAILCGAKVLLLIVEHKISRAIDELRRRFLTKLHEPEPGVVYGATGLRKIGIGSVL